MLAGVLVAFLILIFSMRSCNRPPGAPFFLLRRRKNMERKTPLRAGVVPALRTHPLGWVSVVRVVMFRLPDKLASASVPCKLVCGPLAASLLLTHCGCDLKAFFQGCTLFRFNEKGFRNGSLQVSTMRRKRKRSGKRFAYQAGQRMQSQVSWHPVQCAAVVPTPYQGWVLRAGPPALSGVFLPLFFLRRRRKNGAPGGR